MEDLLSEDARYKLAILNTFEIKKNQTISIDYFCELLGISKFKIQKYIEELNIECVTEQSFSDFIVIERGDLICFDITMEQIREQRLTYLLESPTFKLFHEILCNPTTIEKFSKKYFLSLSKAYGIKKDLNKFLKKWKCTLKKDHIEGDELVIRNLFFEVYYYFYNGISFPFSEEVFSATNQLYRNLVTAFNLSIPPTQRVKLEIFLAIQWLRIKNNHWIEKPYVEVPIESLTKLQSITSVYREEPDIMTTGEQAYVFLFLSTQDIVKVPILYVDDEINTKVKQLTTAFIMEMKTHLNLENRPLIKNEQEIYQHLERQLQQIHARFFSFKFTSSTFISENQIQFFEEGHPKFHQMITAFIQDLDRKAILILSENEKVKLYYDYMFAMAMLLPNHYIENEIYVCVDFSHGPTYSSYIAQTIQSFKNFNIVVEQKIRANTDLYISDFLIKKLNCPQIIWKNPPTASDWEDFGNKIIEIKGEKQ